MKIRIIFTVLIVLLLTPWPAVYAYENTVSDDTPVQITLACSDTFPVLSGYGHAVGSVVPGDLFYIDMTDTLSDSTFTLFLTNTDKLVQNYRYMNLKVGIYIQMVPDNWQKLEPTGDVYLTMETGRACFKLPGYGRYKVSIDGGCFYRYGPGANIDSLIPKFYLLAK